MTEPIIISLHVPKCAGDSLRVTLQKTYGDGAVMDYGDSPFNPSKPVNTDPDYFKKLDKNAFGFLKDKRLVHGHFHPNKYRALDGALRITVLRDPVDRLISHYFFWKYYPPKDHPLRQYLFEHQLSLEAFAEIPMVRRFYSGVFFKDVDMTRFNIIGSVSYMSYFYDSFAKLTGTSLELPFVNTNPYNNYRELKKTIVDDPKRMNYLRSLFADDIAFYERWAGTGC
jgi:hypothetical protein